MARRGVAQWSLQQCCNVVLALSHEFKVSVDQGTLANSSRSGTCGPDKPRGHTNPDFGPLKSPQPPQGRDDVGVVTTRRNTATMGTRPRDSLAEQPVRQSKVESLLNRRESRGDGDQEDDSEAASVAENDDPHHAHGEEIVQKVLDEAGLPLGLDARSAPLLHDLTALAIPNRHDNIIEDEFEAIQPTPLGCRMVWRRDGTVRRLGAALYSAVWQKHTLAQRQAVEDERLPAFEALLPVLRRIGLVLRATGTGRRHGTDAMTIIRCIDVSDYLQDHMQRVMSLHQDAMVKPRSFFDEPPDLDASVYSIEERRVICLAWEVVKKRRESEDTESEEGVEQTRVQDEDSLTTEE